MEVAVNKLMHFFSASPTATNTLEKRLNFIKAYWELEKLALLRVPDAMQSAIYLGLPFTQYEWGGILPLMPGEIIRLIPEKYSVDGYPPSSALSEIAGYGNVDGVAAYIEVFEPGHFRSDDFRMALSKAMRFGHTGCTEILVHYSTPNIEDFKKAAAFGHTGVVAETIEYMSVDDALSAIIGAAKFGHSKTVDLIIESCGAPTEMIAKAYNAAKNYGHVDTMNVIKKYIV